MRYLALRLKWFLLAGFLGLCSVSSVQAQSPAPVSALPYMPALSELPALPPNPVPGNTNATPVGISGAASDLKALVAAPPLYGLVEGPEFTPSYGRFQYSLFFTSEEIERMKQVLNLVESQRDQSTPYVQVNDDFTKLLEQTVTVPSEPPNYPNFHLSSLTYKGPNEWAFWINDKKYTPKKLPPDITVLAISARSVTLAWAPSFIDTAYARWKANEVNRSLPKNRLAQQASDVTYRSSPPAFVFTLAPNQSYVGGAFAVYEGRQIETVNMPLSPNALLAMPSHNNSHIPVSVPPAGSVNKENPQAGIPQMQEGNQSLEGLNSANPNVPTPAQVYPPLASPPSLMPPVPTPPPGAEPVERISLF